MRLGRTLPELPDHLLFEPDEWRAAFIAQHGGLLGRKGDGEPGARTI